MSSCCSQILHNASQRQIGDAALRIIFTSGTPYWNRRTSPYATLCISPRLFDLGSDDLADDRVEVQLHWMPLDSIMPV